MDRLPLVMLALALIGCDDGAAPVAGPGRVVAVAAEREDPLAQLCDETPDRPLTMPPLAEGAAPAASGARWVNVWATWCRPCVEELPLLGRFSERLREDGHPVDLVFLSADRDAEAVATFRGEHPETPASLRFADPAALPAWAVSVGLDEGATLPIHLLVDPAGRVRCARTGSVTERDYDAVRGVFSAM